MDEIDLTKLTEPELMELLRRISDEIELRFMQKSGEAE